jgi:hypothetical protein
MNTGSRIKKSKLCSRCGFFRPREDFIYAGIMRTFCVQHHREYIKEDYYKHVQQRRAWHRLHNIKRRKKHRQNQKDNLAFYRSLALEYYSDGTFSCKCCGESTDEFLALDHIYGEGEMHRKKIIRGEGGLHTYRWAAKNGFPPIFRVLCHNCNESLAYYGYCPHQNKKEGKKCSEKHLIRLPKLEKF